MRVNITHNINLKKITTLSRFKLLLKYGIYTVSCFFVGFLMFIYSTLNKKRRKPMEDKQTPSDELLEKI